MIIAYYCTFLFYGLYTQLKAREKALRIVVSSLLEIPVCGRIFGVW